MDVSFLRVPPFWVVSKENQQEIRLAIYCCSICIYFIIVIIIIIIVVIVVIAIIVRIVLLFA